MIQVEGALIGNYNEVGLEAFDIDPLPDGVGFVCVVCVKTLDSLGGL